MLRWFGVDAWAQDNLNTLAPQNKRIITRWIEGAQAAARELEEDFYSRNPSLRSTNIVKYFCNLQLHDVLRGYVSREAAASDYAVALHDDLSIDAEATNALRAGRTAS
jgi:hypothetical protein